MKTNTVAQRAIENLRRAQASKAESATKTNGIWTQELWDEIDGTDGKTLSIENAKAILNDSATKYPVTDEDIVETDVCITVRAESYDKRKPVPERAVFNPGQKTPTIDRIMAFAMDAKVTVVKAPDMEDGPEVRAYFGVRTSSGEVYRTGGQANVALAVAKAITADPVIVLVPITEDEAVEM